MKSIFYSLVFIAIVSCNNSKSTDNEVVTTTDSMMKNSPIVGNDVDEHGCKPSTGYSWSIIKNECMRIFETGSEFTAAGVNKDSTFAAFIILSPKNDSAEVFLPNIKPFIAVKASKNNLFENKSENIEIAFDKSFINILKNKKVIFKRSKSEGIGKVLNLK